MAVPFDSIGQMKTGAVQLIQFLLIADDKEGGEGAKKTKWVI